MKDKEINYYRFKQIEYILLFVIVFFSMSLSFQYFTGQTKDIATNSEVYMTYIGIGFLGYLALAIQNRKKYIQLYSDLNFQKNQPKKWRVIHQYFPIILFVLMILGQGSWFSIPYLVWFYSILGLMIFFLVISIQYSQRILKKLTNK